MKERLLQAQKVAGVRRFMVIRFFLNLLAFLSFGSIVAFVSLSVFAEQGEDFFPGWWDIVFFWGMMAIFVLSASAAHLLKNK